MLLGNSPFNVHYVNHRRDKMIIGIPNNSANIRKPFKTLKELNQIIKAFEILYDIIPEIEIKGYLSSEQDPFAYFDYYPVKKVTSKGIYFKEEPDTNEIHKGYCSEKCKQIAMDKIAKENPENPDLEIECATDGIIQ